MPVYPGVSDNAAGQTIIEERYTRMASQRKTARLFNNLAVAFTIVFLTIHLRARGGSTGGAKLVTNEWLLGVGDMLAWFFLFMGFGYGSPRREQEWVLRLGMMLSSAALMAHVLNLNPVRLRGIGDILGMEDDPGQTTLLIGVLAQLAGLGCRINVINVGAGYLKDKKATRMARAVKKSK